MPAEAVLVMGVCGAGKSTVARALADRLAGSFVEADAFHPAENIAAMRAGVPLTDAMRWSWLDRVAEAARAAAPRPAVIACSALKRSYRDRLRAKLGPLVLVHLRGERAVLAARMAAREGHFMPAALLDSQFADLEPPEAEEALVLDVAAAPDEIATAAEAFARAALAQWRPQARKAQDVSPKGG